MSNQSEVLAPPGMNTTTPFLNTILNTSTSTVLPYDDLHTIAAQDITSRANYIYSFLAALGFVAGCFLFYSFIQTYRALKRLAWLNRLLWAFCGLQLLLLLLSLHVVVYIPHYLHTTGLGCAALSFTINTVSLCSLFVLVLMAYVLTLDPPSHALLRKPWVCGALVSLTSFLIALMLAGLRGPREGMQVEYMCVMDPVSAGVSYAAARLCLAFLIPYLLQLGLLMAGCVRQWKSRRRFLSGSEEGPVFLTVTVVMFFCQLFYSVVLVRGAQLAQKEGLSKQLCSYLVRGAQLAQEGLSCHEQAFLTVAEFVLFSGSSASLLIVLLMHRPCRESLHGALRQLRDCCRSPGASQTNRNIIAPHIEITDTLQDIE